MSFLGKKLVGQFRGELLSDSTDRCKRRFPGVRIKHRVKMNWIKMYDKAGSVLRVEMVINDPEAFKVRKQVRPYGNQVTQWFPMRKGVANLFRYRDGRWPLTIAISMRWRSLANSYSCSDWRME